MKRLLFVFPAFRFMREHDLLSKQARRQYFIYRFFRFFFGLNKEAPFAVNFTSIVLVPQKMQLGKGVSKSIILSGNCYFQAINGIRIGDETIIAPGVKIISAGHEPGQLEQHQPAAPVIVGKNCWLGANSVVLPGVELGNNTIVAAGAVVTKSFPQGNIVLKGVPASASSLG